MNKIEYVKVLPEEIGLKVMTNSLPTKGNLVYEYNPFRNYRLTENKYLYKDDYYTLDELEEKFKIFISDDKKHWTGLTTEEEPILFEKGQLIDFITDELNFSLDHPVHMIPQYSYDGSVNLIINDGINTPRLINSRFSATGRNTYEIIDRSGNNDTNIYDLGVLFDVDTSLYKRVTKIPKLEFSGVLAGGNLRIGNYHFYFKFSDADGNETDFIAESGLVSVFIGFDSPYSVHTGQKHENSTKQVKFILSNIDDSYNYVTVYFTRSTSEAHFNAVTDYVKIDKKYVVNNANYATIIVTGFEQFLDVTPADINVLYNIVDAANTSAVCLNMLFMGNVHKPDIPYEKLKDLSLRFLPYLKLVNYNMDMDEEYNISSTNKGYYDPKFIYSKTGYWGNELYRIGIVYILANGELTPEFDIRGRENVGVFNEASDFFKDSLKKSKYNDGQYHHFALKNAITIKEDNNYILLPKEDGDIPAINGGAYENAKGVISLNPNLDTDKIYALDIRVDDEVVLELKKYVKGYFFVRQKRIPTILALGITIGIDSASHTPTIPTCLGYLGELANTLPDSTYVESEDINGINYISEGFLSRFNFKLAKKSSGIWGKIGKVFAVTALVVASVAASVVTFGGAAVAAGVATAAAAVGMNATAFTIAAATVTGLAVGTAAATTTIAVGSIHEGILAVQRLTNKKVLKGRYTDIPHGYKREEREESRKLGGDFISRIIIKDHNSNSISGLLCPDYSINLEYYNLIFTGNKHVLRTTISQGVNILTGYSKNYFTNDNRHFYMPSYYDTVDRKSYISKIIGVPDSVKLIGLENNKYRSRAGSAEEAWRFELVGTEYTDSKDTKINSDIIRGDFGPYLGLSKYPENPAETVDIMIPGYSDSNLEEYIQLRCDDKSSFYAISDRIALEDLDTYLIGGLNNIVANRSRDNGYQFEIYRGDCYLCLFTLRIIRNFNDSAAPYNDEIVDELTWKNNFDPDKSELYANINTGDVNAVQLGMWVTFKVRSSNNLNIRTLDGSEVNETAMTGHPKGYFPQLPMSVEGTYKTADSSVYNKGFKVSTSERWNFELPDVPHIKNWFGTRIIYSDININDAYRNSFRVFQGLHFKDYTREYGEIVKLITMESNLLCVFEHGVALIPVNERAVAGEGAGGNVFINTSNVLPDNPKIISDMYGSQWAESVLKVPGKSGDSPQYVYGVDTVAKKIWRTDGNTLQCISDFKVQEFLNNNISLGERELTPRIGIRNVKTMYNAYKKDVLFTFYDNTYGFEEKVWNLCWNELLQKFITFYSWVPSYMENINNIPFSFNRDVSKWIAKLGTTHSKSSMADGITLSNVTLNNTFPLVDNYSFDYSYKTIDGSFKKITLQVPKNDNFIGVLLLHNRVLPEENTFYLITFSLERDSYLNYKNYEIRNVLSYTLPSDAVYKNEVVNFLGLFYIGDNPQDLCSEMYYRNSANHVYSDYIENSLEPIFIKDGELIVSKQIHFNYPIYKDISGKRNTLPKELQINPDKLVLLLNIKANISIKTTDSSLGLSDTYYNMKAAYAPNTSLINSGYYESVVAIMPKWNFQFLTSDFWKHGQAGLIDITDTIFPTYWYGRQHPFEFEFVVVNDPSIHKIFDNLEIISNKAKPESFHYEIIGECYDFAKDKPNIYFRQEAMKALWQYNGADISYNRNFLKTKLLLLNKSADLIHIYYNRVDTINEVEDNYLKIINPKGYNYNHLSGAEIKYYPNRQEYRICNHVLAVDIDDLSLDTARSIILANCKYLEDRWEVTINPILICYKNEYTNIQSLKDFIPENSTWAKAKNSSSLLPSLPIYNSPIPNDIKLKDSIEFPETSDTNALYNLYDLSNYNSYGGWKPLDLTNWLNNVRISSERKEIDLKDKFIKIKIRYSGEDLVIIDFLNTIYRVSHA